MVSHVWILPANVAAALHRDEKREMEDLTLRRTTFLQGLLLSIAAVIRIAASCLFPWMVQVLGSWAPLSLVITIAVAGNCVDILCVASHPVIYVFCDCSNAVNYYRRARKQVDEWLGGYSSSSNNNGAATVRYIPG